MAGVDLGTVLRHLRRLFDRPGCPTPTDAEILARFVAERDEGAFELLVWRHGPAVLGLCRRMLRREQDAEDAFQATFLTLARRAGAIGRRQSVGSWLFKVAYRIALRARERAARLSVVPLAGQPEPAGPPPGGPDAEVRSLLDEEVSRLPDKYRAAVVLCYLQGKTNSEAARELGCPRGTIDSRLAWARQRLRQRLTRRGVTLSLAGLVSQFAPSSSAAVPAAIVSATSHLALQFATRGAALAGLASTPAVQLAQGVLHAMFLTKLKTTLAVVLAVAAVVTGSWGTFRAQQPLAEPQPPAVEGQTPPAVQPQPGDREPDSETWVPEATLRGDPEQTVLCVAFSPDGKILASGSGTHADKSGALCLWAVEGGKRLAHQTTEHAVRSLAFSPDGRLLATAEPHQVTRLRDPKTGMPRAYFDLVDPSAEVVAFSPDGRLLATGNTDGSVRLWDVAGTEARKQVRTIWVRESIRSLAFSPDGRRLAAASPDGKARLWDVSTGKEIAALPGHRVAFSPNLRPNGVLVTAETGGNVLLWDVAAVKDLRGFKVPFRAVLCVIVAPDGTTLAASGGGTGEGNADRAAGEIILWNAATGKTKARLRGHSDRVFAIAFSPDGKRLASASRDGTVIIWHRQVQAVARPAPRPDHLVSDRLDQLLNQLLKGNRTDEQIAESLYLATIGRLPTDSEKARFTKLQRERPDARQQTFEQLLKALTENPECRAHLKTLQERTKDIPEW